MPRTKDECQSTLTGIGTGRARLTVGTKSMKCPDEDEQIYRVSYKHQRHDRLLSVIIQTEQTAGRRGRVPPSVHPKKQ